MPGLRAGNRQAKVGYPAADDEDRRRSPDVPVGRILPAGGVGFSAQETCAFRDRACKYADVESNCAEVARDRTIGARGREVYQEVAVHAIVHTKPITYSLSYCLSYF